MITIDVAEYCSACMDFDPDVQRPQKAYGMSEENVKAPVTADIAAPILRETVSRVVDGKVVTMYKDELEKILYKDLYSHLGLQFGG